MDFLTIHLLPYWEDDPSSIDEALKHVGDVRQTFGNKFAPKDVLIGETGWPSEGRQRETAVPSQSMKPSSCVVLWRWPKPMAGATT